MEHLHQQKKPTNSSLRRKYFSFCSSNKSTVRGVDKHDFIQKLYEPIIVSLADFICFRSFCVRSRDLESNGFMSEKLYYRWKSAINM